MKKITVVAVIGLAVLSMLSCGKDPNEGKAHESGNAGKGDPGYAYKLTVEKMEFNWTIDADKLRVKVKAKTQGWVGIGFNPTEGMKDANFIIGYVKDGVATVSNHYGMSRTLHKKIDDLGGTAHLINPAGSEKKDETEISFAIPLKTGEKLDRPINVAGETVVLLAYGKSKQLAQVHQFRARAKVNLSNGAYSVILIKI